MQSVITATFFKFSTNFRIFEKKYDADWHLHAAASETCYSHWHSLRCRTASLCRSSGYCPQQHSALTCRLCKNGGAENAGLENAAPDCRGGKRGTGKCRSLKSMESEDFKNVFLTVLIERIVWKQTRTLLLHKGGRSRDDFLGVLKVNLSNY